MNHAWNFLTCWYLPPAGAKDMALVVVLALQSLEGNAQLSFARYLQGPLFSLQQQLPRNESASNLNNGKIKYC